MVMFQGSSAAFHRHSADSLCAHLSASALAIMCRLPLCEAYFAVASMLAELAEVAALLTELNAVSVTEVRLR